MVRSLRYAALAVLLVAGMAFGQGKAALKGGYLGDLRFDTKYGFHSQLEGSTGSNSDFRFGLSPRLDYFVKDGLGVGGGFRFDYSSTTYKQTELSIGPQVDYYFTQWERPRSMSGCLAYLGPGDCIPHVGFSAQLLADRTDYGPTYGPTTDYGWSTRFEVGVAPIIGERVSFPLDLGFGIQNAKPQLSTLRQTQYCFDVCTGCGVFLYK
ncbi:MAG TPA: hypothetical protein VMH22_03900 [bacterium]|nr:hypothetical protein [bacterium]